MCNESGLQVSPGDRRHHLPTTLSARTSDKQLKGNFLGSEANSDSQVPSIQTHTVCELGPINLTVSNTWKTTLLEGADTFSGNV